MVAFRYQYEWKATATFFVSPTYFQEKKVIEMENKKKGFNFI